MRPTIAVLCTLVVLTLVGSAQPPASPPLTSQQPVATFRTGVDLITVEAAVLDEQGRPVPDLTPSDFTVTLAGQPRKVLFARFLKSDSSVTVPPATDLPPTALHVTNVATTGGRLVMFVVDRDTIRTGGERVMLDAAGAVFDALTPADAAGVLGLPSGGIKPTRELERVREELRRMTGTMPRPVWRWYISWDEAAGIERQDKQLYAQVIARECRSPRRPRAGEEDLPPDRVPEACDVGVGNQAMEMLMNARSQARSTLINLGTLADRLRPLRGPKHIVFVSGGLFFEQGLISEYTEFARQAALAGIVMHTIHLDQPDAEVTTSVRNITSVMGSREMSTGLTNIAGLTGGGFYMGVGAAEGAFDRITKEITSYYELGLETVAADANAQPRDIEVKVTRPGVKVRARSQVALDLSAGTRRPTAESLQTLLEQPTDIAELPLAVTAYTTRGDDPSRLKVLIAADLAAPATRGPAHWAFMVLSDGNPVATGRSTTDPTVAAPWNVTASAKLLPGQHRLRFAAIDADGRAGVVDLPLPVGLRAAGDLQLSDLIIGRVATDRLQPGSRIVQGTTLAAMAEVLSPDPGRLAKTRVALELVPGGATEPVQRVLMAARTKDSDVLLLNEAQIDTTNLPLGRYTASAIALVDNQPVGRVSRVFEIVQK